MLLRFAVPLLLLLNLSACAPSGSDQPCYVAPSRDSTHIGNQLGRMTVWNTPQWCGFALRKEAALNYTDAVVVQAPEHGRTRVRQTAAGPVVDYMATHGFVGRDQYHATFLPESITVYVDVDVVPQPASLVAAQPAPAATSAPQAVEANLVRLRQQIAARSSPDPGPPTSQLDPVTGPIGWRCLPPGTVQTFTNGVAITWLGRDPSHDDLCIGRNNSGNPVQSVRGMWSIGSTWPDSLPALRGGIAELTTRPPGFVATFTITAGSSNTADPRPGTWTHSLLVLGRESITIAAGRFQAVAIEDDERSTGGGHWVKRWWLDTATGAFLKSETLASSNGSSSKSETTSLRLPR